MIITCASCLTKFSLEDSRISPKGAKVRCSRCKHVFYIIPPHETQEKIIEVFESFAKYHEELIEPGVKEKESPSLPEEEEESLLFSERPSGEREKRVVPLEPVKEERAKVKAVTPGRMAGGAMRGPSRVFSLLLILVLLVFGLFYFWTELSSGGRLSAYLEYPVKKATALWETIWGTEKEGLTVRDLNGYEETVSEISLYIIEGKVINQSQVTKKHVKIRVSIFDAKKEKLGEKETVCGRILSLGELKNLPGAFFQGEMVIRPQTEKESIVPPGKIAPFIVIFKELGSAREFKVEIVEAPNL